MQSATPTPEPDPRELKSELNECQNVECPSDRLGRPAGDLGRQPHRLHSWRQGRPDWAAAGLDHQLQCAVRVSFPEFLDRGVLGPDRPALRFAIFISEGVAALK